MKKNLKAQAAMEYLMTYGWAILIVVIVAAALFALGVFNPGTFTGTRCTGMTNLGCPTDWQVTEAGAFNVVIKNGLGQQITITGVTVIIGSTTVTTGTVSNVTATGATTSYSPVGSATAFSALTSGDSYTASIDVNYTVSGGTFTRTDSGTLTGSVV